MRSVSMPWVWLAVIVFACGEVALPSEAHVATAPLEDVESITRDIALPARAHAGSVHSMSGAITLGRDSRVIGDVETGNGEIFLERGVEITGKLANTTGTIRIDGARVGGRVSTTYGDIYIGADSRIDGGILVNKRSVIGLSFGDLKLGFPIGSRTPPRVIIGPRATVAGVLRFKRKVELLVSESATIGPVIGATPVMVAAEQLPN
jgi:cytoskeletal protein CcmA (bactofilin family)